jgi:sterol 3beta-glucosyltransferase
MELESDPAGGHGPRMNRPQPQPHHDRAPATPRRVRVTILTVGSRGDVHPYLALGAGLHRAGHQVTVATHRPFASDTRHHGLGFAPLDANPRQLLESDAGRAWLEAGANPIAGARRLVALARPLLARLLADATAACEHADAIIYAPLALAGPHIAERTGALAVLAPLVPVAPTRAFPDIGAPPWPLGGLYNRLTHLVGGQLGWQPFRRQVNHWRRSTLGLGPAPLLGPLARRRRHAPVLHGYSPCLLPKPPDWGEHLHVTGYWFPDPNPQWQPPAALARFLAAGAPPVYVGFGSMTDRDPAGLAGLAVTALRRAGCRGLLQRGWADLAPAQDLDLDGDDVLTVDEIPHDWLFPKLAAVVHHGGVGTTHTGLRAGIPTVVVPFFTDQPFWARRVAALGVGPAPIPRRQLTVDRLTAALRHATSNPAMHARAAALGIRIRGEDGVHAAGAAFDHHLADHQTRLHPA